MSRQFCSTHIACQCIVVFYGISHAANLSPWRSHFNYILRRIWRLPRNCHTRILHKVAHLDSVLLVCLSRRICESKSYLLHDTSTSFYTSAFTPVSSNHYSAHKYRKSNLLCWLCKIRLNKICWALSILICCKRPEVMIATVCCD